MIRIFLNKIMKNSHQNDLDAKIWIQLSLLKKKLKYFKS